MVVRTEYGNKAVVNIISDSVLDQGIVGAVIKYKANVIVTESVIDQSVIGKLLQIKSVP